MMDLSIVIPLYNEDESIDELHSKIVSSLSNSSLNYEIIFIDDGSSDNSWNIIKDVTKRVHNTRASAGFKSTRGEVVVTMDADLQDDPNEILQLYNVLINEDYHIVSGWKKKRYDSVIFKNLPSKLFNWAARLSSGIKLNDFNCGIKAYKSDVIKEIKLTSGMHRYIPVLAKNSGFNKIGEKIVLHHPRKHGKTKYGADRFIKGFLDLITLSFIERFGKRPMHFFGLFGTFILVTGLIFSIYLGIDKLFINTTSRLITERPEFYIALASMIIGSQFFLAGFLGEIILRNKKLDNYKIKEKINLDE